MSESYPDSVDEERELYEHYRLQADKGQSQIRIDKFLVNRLEGVSRNRIQNAARADCILVNDQAVKPNYKIKPLDVVSIVLPTPPRDTEIKPQDIPLEIIYEDQDLLIVNKAPGMVVHPGFNNYEGTLLHALLFHFRKGGDEALFPLLVHRIDKDTSGLLVVAKTEFAQTHLARQFFEHTVDRCYTALIWGEPDTQIGTIEGFIGRSPRDRRQMELFDDPSSGKHSVTHFTILRRYGFTSLIECRLETGRTHQIRSHMRHIGHPIFNDQMYGGDRILKGLKTSATYQQFVRNCFETLPRQALHARTIGFIHPSTGVKMQFESPLPEDFQLAVDMWEQNASIHHN